MSEEGKKAATIEELQEEIKDLKSEIVKQRGIIAKTAQQLLALQVKDTKKQMDAIPNPLDSLDNKNSNIDTTDFATNEDLVQLVGELQGQLNLIEQKSISRTANSHLNKETDELFALPNVDGEFPAVEIFPRIISEFSNLGDDAIIDLCKFYQLLPPTLEERAKMQAFVEGKIASPNDPLNKDYEPPADDYPPETINELYNELANFLGISHIKRSETKLL